MLGYSHFSFVLVLVSIDGYPINNKNNIFGNLRFPFSELRKVPEILVHSPHPPITPTNKHFGPKDDENWCSQIYLNDLLDAKPYPIFGSLSLLQPIQTEDSHDNPIIVCLRRGGIDPEGNADLLTELSSDSLSRRTTPEPVSFDVWKYSTDGTLEYLDQEFGDFIPDGLASPRYRVPPFSAILASLANLFLIYNTNPTFPKDNSSTWYDSNPNSTIEDSIPVNIETFQSGLGGDSNTDEKRHWFRPPHLPAIFFAFGRPTSEDTTTTTTTTSTTKPKEYLNSRVEHVTKKLDKTIDQEVSQGRVKHIIEAAI